MPSYTWECKCGAQTVVRDVKTADRDKIGPNHACNKCKSGTWSRLFCEAKNFDTHFSGSHRLEYNKTGRRHGY